MAFLVLSMSAVPRAGQNSWSQPVEKNGSPKMDPNKHVPGCKSPFPEKKKEAARQEMQNAQEMQHVPRLPTCGLFESESVCSKPGPGSEPRLCHLLQQL